MPLKGVVTRKPLNKGTLRKHSLAQYSAAFLMSRSSAIRFSSASRRRISALCSSSWTRCSVFGQMQALKNSQDWEPTQGDMSRPALLAMLYPEANIARLLYLCRSYRNLWEEHFGNRTAIHAFVVFINDFCHYNLDIKGLQQIFFLLIDIIHVKENVVFD